MKRSLRLALLTTMMAIICGSAFANSRSVILLNDVHVTGTTVRLADLLPQNAPNDLRDAGSLIELGQAPQLGSLRVYEGARVAEILKVHPEVARRVVIPDRVLIRRSTYDIAPAAIHEAFSNYLRETGQTMDLSNVVLRPADGVTSLEENPKLQVRRVNWDAAKHQYELRLHCVEIAACRDFLVYLQDPHDLTARPSKALVCNRDGRAKAALASATGANPILIAAGRQVRMIMQGDGIQISLTVISLESGQAGQKIRVRNRDNRQTFLAEVLSGNLVRGKIDS